MEHLLINTLVRKYILYAKDYWCYNDTKSLQYKRFLDIFSDLEEEGIYEICEARFIQETIEFVVNWNILEDRYNEESYDFYLERLDYFTKKIAKILTVADIDLEPLYGSKDISEIEK